MKLKITFAAALGGFLLTMAVTAAFGHAALESSDPADGATILSPYAITATFDEELTASGSSIIVQNSSGTQVANGTVSTTDDKTMTVQLPSVPDGQYEVLWTAVTADDLAVERGTYHFTVGAPVPSATVAVVTPAPSSAPGQALGSTTDLLVPLLVVVVVVVAIAGYLIYRNRR